MAIQKGSDAEGERLSGSEKDSDRIGKLVLMGHHSYNKSMVAFRGHFDGHVIIPDGQLSLPCDRDLIFQVESGPRLVNGRKLLKYAGTLDEQTATEMLVAINDCERIDDGW